MSSDWLMRKSSVQCMHNEGLHQMHYTEWGDSHNGDVVLCVHGLTRNGRDFDDLAGRLCDRYRVVCPDIVGRGHSDWVINPANYSIPSYMRDIVTLIARIQPERLVFLGTSLGGIIGMMLAALPNNPITKLVLNDVGPVLNGAAVERISEYVGRTVNFKTTDEAEQYLRKECASFGPLTDEQWRHLTTHSLAELPTGGFVMRYDPNIGKVFRESKWPENFTLWPAYDEIKCPTLVLRGADSDLLTADIAKKMTTRGPKAKLVEFAGVGHAPMLMAEDQIAAVSEFLGAA